MTIGFDNLAGTLLTSSMLALSSPSTVSSSNQGPLVGSVELLISIQSRQFLVNMSSHLDYSYIDAPRWGAAWSSLFLQPDLSTGKGGMHVKRRAGLAASAAAVVHEDPALFVLLGGWQSQGSMGSQLGCLHVEAASWDVSMLKPPGDVSGHSCSG